jgi:hypothetical protein
VAESFDSAVRTVTGAADLTITPLSANGVYAQPVVDNGADPQTWPTRVRPTVTHATGNRVGAGHLIFEESSDGLVWGERRVPVPADGLPHTFDWPVHQRFNRLRFVNGGVAQASMLLTNLTLRGEGNSIDVHNVLTFLETPSGGSTLAATAAIVGSTLDLGANHNWAVIRAAMIGDTTGASLRVDQSWDGAIWFADAPTAQTYNSVGSIQQIESRVSARYVRSRILNGANAATGVRLATTLVSL